MGTVCIIAFLVIMCIISVIVLILIVLIIITQRRLSSRRNHSEGSLIQYDAAVFLVWFYVVFLIHMNIFLLLYRILHDRYPCTLQKRH